MRGWTVRLLITTALGLMVLNGCTTKKGNPVGLDIFQRDQFGEELDLTLYATSSDTFYYEDVQSGLSGSLLLGSRHGREFQTFHRIQVSDLPDSSTVDSAIVYLFIQETLGDSLQIAPPQVWEVNGTWHEEEIINQTVIDEGLQGPALNMEPFIINPDTLSFRLPVEFLQKWVDDSLEADKGFMLSYAPQDDGNILRLFASDFGSNNGYIHLYSHRDTTKSDKKCFFLNDAFVSQYEINADRDHLWIHDGINYRSYLYFDLSAVPPNATINYAEFNLWVDTLQSWPDNTPELAVQTLRVNSEFLPGSGAIPEVAEESMHAALLAKDSLAMAMTTQVQGWTSGFQENHGFVLVGSSENAFWASRSFYSTTADSAHRPKLRLIYSLPPVGSTDEE